MADFSQLKPYQKRDFVPRGADLTDLQTVKGLYGELLERAIGSVSEFEKWVLDRSEMEASLDQAGSILYIRMTCQTDDKERADAYQKFIETVVPAVQPLDDELNKKFLKTLEQYSLDPDFYAVYIRGIRADIELFVPANVELQTKVALLSQQYQSICGAMTVEFDGEERTLPAMGKFLLDPDRDLRERAWRATSERRLRDKDKLEDIFDQMLKLRVEIATNAKCANFCDYKFRSLHRFDYTPQDCREYHKVMEEIVVPIWKKILEKRKARMNVDALRPWDTSVDPLGRGALKPFAQVDTLIGGCQKIFDEVDPVLSEYYREMVERGLLDLESRKGKAPGGYQSALDESRKPFIFMNAVGVDGDVRTLLHEAGHAFHVMAAADIGLVDYRHGPMEFNEVASMAMELLGDENLNAFYNDEDAARSREDHLESVVFTLVWVATIDSFQHWIYENPQHTREDRVAKWKEIYSQYSGGVVDWSGFEDRLSYLWHRQLHIFEVPFYYIEYGIAQLGALQLWLKSQVDRPKAVAGYRKGLALGGSRPLPELYAAAGIKFDFSRDIIVPLMDAVQDRLALK